MKGAPAREFAGEWARLSRLGQFARRVLGSGAFSMPVAGRRTSPGAVAADAWRYCGATSVPGQGRITRGASGHPECTPCRRDPAPRCGSYGCSLSAARASPCLRASWASVQAVCSRCFRRPWRAAGESQRRQRLRSKLMHKASAGWPVGAPPVGRERVWTFARIRRRSAPAVLVAPRRLDELPDHLQACSRGPPERDERDNGKTGRDERHERAKLAPQRGEIGVEALPLGCDVCTDLLGTSLFRHGSAASRPCGSPPRLPAPASGAKPC